MIFLLYLDEKHKNCTVHNARRQLLHTVLQGAQPAYLVDGLVLGGGFFLLVADRLGTQVKGRPFAGGAPTLPP